MEIKKKVASLIKKYKTSNPFEIAEMNNITIVFGDLGGKYLGNYMKYRRSKFIIIDKKRTPETMIPFICAHELGHALCTPNDNTNWLKTYTMSINADKVERIANKFAVELLLNDELVSNYPDYSIYAVGRSVGIPDNLINLKKI